jgi:alpha-glucoside transport system substrate-binding protein
VDIPWRSWLPVPGPRWRRAGGSALYLAIVAAMGTVLGSVFADYLGPRPNLPVSTSVSPSMLATWEGAEERAFQAILDNFQREHRIKVSYRTAREQLPFYLNDSLSRGQGPDVAILPQPGELADLARSGRLVPLDGMVDARSLADMDDIWARYASWEGDGRRYGVFFKAANKSVIWYRPDLFQRAGIDRPPDTWDDLLADMRKLRGNGIIPFAMCGGSGWTLTDWFENIYLRTAPLSAYQELAGHRRPWTDPTVADALKRMAEVFEPANVVGAAQGISAISYPHCVDLVFSRESPYEDVAMVMEGDFVQNQVKSLGQATGDGPRRYDFFPFPAINRDRPPAVVVGGDVAVMLHRTPEAVALIDYLATAGAGRAWARQGGFISPHRSVTAYPSEVSRRLAAGVANPDAALAFDMSDLAPAGFGSTANLGEWAALQRWLAHGDPGSPDAIQAVQEQLEAAARATYPPP